MGSVTKATPFLLLIIHSFAVWDTALEILEIVDLHMECLLEVLVKRVMQAKHRALLRSTKGLSDGIQIENIHVVV